MGAANRRVLTGCQRPGFTWLWPLPRQTRVSSPFQPQRSRSRGRSRKPLPGVTGADADTPRRWPGAAGATTGWATVMPTASGQRSLEDPFFKQGGGTHTHIGLAPAPRLLTIQLGQRSSSLLFAQVTKGTWKTRSCKQWKAFNSDRCRPEASPLTGVGGRCGGQKAQGGLAWVLPPPRSTAGICPRVRAASRCFHL